jgi:hypothetical protein
MQIALNLNLIINEVSDSQIAAPHQKLAGTSVHRARQTSAGPHAKPLLVASLAWPVGRVPTSTAAQAMAFYTAHPQTPFPHTQRG